MKPQIKRQLNFLATLLLTISVSGVLPIEAFAQQKTPKQDIPEETKLLYEQFAKAYDSGDYPRALRVGEEMVKSWERLVGSNHPSFAAALNNLALVYREMGERDKAKNLHERSLKIAINTLGPEDPAIASYLSNLADVYSDEGAYTYAEELILHALQIVSKKKGQESLEAADLIFSLASLALNKGDYENALRLCRRSLRLTEESLGPEHPEVANTLNLLGVIYERRGNYFRAALRQEHALSIKERLFGSDDPRVSSIVFNLGILYSLQNINVLAEENFQRALKLVERRSGPDSLDTAPILNSLSIIYREKGELDKSEQVARRTIGILEKSGIADHASSVKALHNLARVYLAKGDIEQAISTMIRINDMRESQLLTILAAGSERQKLAYMDMILGETNDTVSLHIQYAPNNARATRLALTTIMQRKGRVLDAISDSIRVLRSKSTSSDQRTLENLLAIRSRIAALTFQKRTTAQAGQIDDQLLILKAEAEDLEASISARSQAFPSKSQPVTIEAIQQLIPEGAALVEIAVFRPYNAKYKRQEEIWGARRYAAYVLGRTGEPGWIDLGETAPIDEMVEVLRKALRNPKRADVKQLARNLDEKVMKPIRNLLGPRHTILISPDGALNMIPLGALVDEEGRYLIERYSFIYFTAGRDLMRLKEKTQSKQAPVVIANPDFNYSETTGATARTRTSPSRENQRAADLETMTFDLLPATADEATALAALLPGPRVLTDKRATETAVKQLKGPSILHVATHGFFLPYWRATDYSPDVTSDTYKGTFGQHIEDPLLRSGMALAGANKKIGTDDGILTALEVAGLDLLGTRLVVLSACETGLGEINDGEGVYGLRRALVIAGAESQVISLWKVDDVATKDLMLAYYRGLLAGEGRNSALRDVQLKMLGDKVRQHPYYWASFIASGDWANLEGKR